MRFLVTYQTDHSRFDKWLSLSEDEREAVNPGLETVWNAWLEAHESSLTETAGVGKPKRVTAAGVEDSRNDIMMYSFVEAESHEAAVEMFKDHPHFGIPGGWIEVMSVNKDIG